MLWLDHERKEKKKQQQHNVTQATRESAVNLSPWSYPAQQSPRGGHGSVP